MFLTGEFSHIARVSKRLLQYYDEIGLLKPAYTDPQTGYRYYSARQLPRLNRILALKDLGLSLDQVAEMMQADVSDQEIHGMLLMKKPAVTVSPTLNGGNIVLSWQSQAATSYQVVSKDNLTDPWTPVGSIIPGDGTVKSVSLLRTGSQRFYAVQTQ